MRKRPLAGLALAFGAIVVLASGIWFAPNLTVQRVKAGGAPPPGSGTLTSQGGVRVVAGDTVETWLNGLQSGIGLIGISAPPGNTPCGEEATGMMWALTGEGIRLEEEPTFTFDAYKRRMYYVYTADGRSIALEMVKAGLARPEGHWRENRQLRVAEAEARKAKTGCLWRYPSERPPTDGLVATLPYESPDTALPANFTQNVLATNLNVPTTFTFLPDGRILIAEKAGVVKVYRNGGVLPTPFIDISAQVNNYWDHGLLGIAADPNFAANGYIYLLYTYEHDPAHFQGTKTARLIRVTASGDVAVPGSEVVLLGTMVGDSCDNFPGGADCLPSDSPSHSIGTLKFAPDGTLFMTAGDGADFNAVDPRAMRSQNLDSLGGKILHITTSGQGLPTNPFYNGDPNANRSKVYAYGVRNSYRFTLRPGTSIPYLGDVGWNSWEEINVAPQGANLGWPCYEGNAHQEGYEPYTGCQALYNQGLEAVEAPLFTWNHNGQSSASTGGTFYFGTIFPAQYQGAYFFGDYALNWIKYVTVDAANNLTGGPYDFATGADGPVDMQMGPNGDLYYCAIGAGEIRRINYSLSSLPPPGLSYLSDLAWTYMSNGYGPVERDMSNGEQFLGDGRTITLNGVTYAKGLGAHSLSEIRYNLGGACSSFMADVGMDDEVDQFALASVTFEVWADGTKLYDSGFMDRFTATRNISVTIQGKDELKLILTDAGDGEWYDSASWAGARVVCVDLTPPTVTEVTPPNGATNVLLTSNATATFAEAMDPDTVNGSTFTLVRRSSGALVNTTISYNSNTRAATLDPIYDLDVGASYTATVKGGPMGVKDTSGNPLAADNVWVFTATTNLPPSPVISQPLPDYLFSVEDLITFSGYATDPEDGVLPSSSLTWTIVLHHCPGGSCHLHPFQTLNGAGGNFTVPDHGEESHFEIILTAMDSAGHTGTSSVTLMPRTMQITLDSVPGGKQLVFNGTGGTAPLTRTVITGSTFTLYAPSPQGNLYFSSWSDGGTQQHNATAITDTTYIATFSPPLLVGHVTWQGRPAQPNALQQLPITLTLRLGNNVIEYPNRTTNASGSFTVSVDSVPAGAYNWRVKGPKYLANSGTLQISNVAVTQVEMNTMRAGDANNDNLIGIQDFGILKPAFGTSVGQPGYDDRADFNGDRIVTVIDFNLLKVNFGQSGAPPLGPGEP